MYTYFNKKTKRTAIYTERSVMCENTGVNAETVDYHLRRKGEEIYETDDFIIEQSDPVKNKKRIRANNLMK